jgi:S1-C subfamily serine protease
LPLVGLEDFVCILGRSSEGKIYVSDSDGGNQRYLNLPAVLPLPPFQFVVFQPVEEENTPITATNVIVAQPRGKTRRNYITAAIASLVIFLASLLVFHQTNKLTVTSTQKQSEDIAVTSFQAALPPEQKETPKSVTEKAAVVQPESNTPSAMPKPDQQPAKFDLEALALRITPSVFRLEVRDSEGKPTGTGTAFAISADGLAVTNFHVIEGGESFTARTNNGAEFAISAVIATDPAADLALIKLKARDLPFLELGESNTTNIGAPVAVFGAPHGLSGTLSEGILSSRRNESQIDKFNMPNSGNLLQITAPISPGSSGSPVFNQSGKVIGVAVAILPGDRIQNLNFVIPAEAVVKLRKDAEAGLADLRQTVGESEQAPSNKTQNPDSAFFSDPDYRKLKTYLDAGDWIQSLKVARPLATKHPESASAHLFLGISLNGLGLNEQAESSFKQGISISEENDHLWLCLGIVQMQMQKKLEARESLKLAAGINPENIQAWQRLAKSYLLDREFLSAITPMECLRKLDREEFDRLITICRDLRPHPAQLVTMLNHFDDMANDLIPEPPKAVPIDEDSQTEATKLASILITEFLKHGEERDVMTELGDYAPVVEPYFVQGRKTAPEILKDLTSYRKQWPQRTLRLIAIESARRDDTETLEATYRLKFTASDGKRNQSGTVIQGIRYTRIKDRWLVSGIETLERVGE